MEQNGEQPTEEGVAAAAEQRIDGPISSRRRSGRGGLVRTLLLVFLPIIIGLLLLVGLAGLIASQRVGEDRAFDSLALVASLKEDGINRWLRERDRDMSVLSSDRDVRKSSTIVLDDAASVEERDEAYRNLTLQLDDFLGEKLSFVEFFFVNAQDGITRVSTDVRQEGLVHLNQDYFQEGLLGPYYRPPQYDPQAGVPTMLISRPVLALDGHTLGVLVGRVYLSDLIVMMQERAGMGETGETYLVNRDLEPLTHLRSGQDGQLVNSEGVRQAIEQGQRGSDRYLNYANAPVFGNYRWLPALEVALLAEQSEAEALAGRTTVSLALIGIVLLGSLFATAAIVFVSRRIARPITELTKAATEMASGDLSRRVAIDRDDEIGALSQAFDEMAGQMDDLIGTLEQRVADRTTDLEQRAARLETASEVGRAAASILDLEILVQRVVDLVRERFSLYYAGLFLVDEVGQFAVLESGTGEPGRIMKEAGHKLEVGGRSMVGTACDMRRARIALDVGEESIRFDNPLLPQTRSEMALPLVVGERVLGALDVQSAESAAFSQEDIVVLQLVADQVAVAIDNARKFSEEAGLLEATSPVYRVSRRLATAVSTDEIARVIINAVAETEADGCAVGRLDFSATGRVESAVFLGSWDRTRESGFPVGIPFSAANSPFPLEMVTSFWSVEDIRKDTGLRQASREFLARFPGRAFVNVPLRVGQQVIGFVSIYRDREGPFSPVSVRLYETLGDQAAVSLERARLLDTTRRRAEQEATLRVMGDRIAQATGLEAVLQVAAESLNSALQGSGVYVELGGADPEGLELEPKSSPLL